MMKVQLSDIRTLASVERRRKVAIAEYLDDNKIDLCEKLSKDAFGSKDLCKLGFMNLFEAFTNIFPCRDCTEAEMIAVFEALGFTVEKEGEANECS